MQINDVCIIVYIIVHRQFMYSIIVYGQLCLYELFMLTVVTYVAIRKSAWHKDKLHSKSLTWIHGFVKI